MSKAAEREMARRDFLAAGFGLAAGPLLSGRGKVLAGAPRPKIAVARGGGQWKPEEAAYRRTKAAVDRLGGLARVVGGKHVLIKMNATEHASQDGNTSPSAAAALLRLCRECGAKHITVLGQEWGGFSARRAGQPTLQQVIQRGGARLLQLPHYWQRGNEAHYRLVTPKDSPWRQLWAARIIFEPDTVLLNLARLKTHPYCVYTGCVKNIIGLTRCMYGFHKIDDTTEPRRRGAPADSDGWHLFPQKLAAAYRDVIGPKIALHILDAGKPTFGWRGPAPERIHTFDAHTTLAGNDALAMDVYGCGILHRHRPNVYVEALGDWSKGRSPYVLKNRAKTNYLLECGRLGAGETNLARVDIDEVEIG